MRFHLSSSVMLGTVYLGLAVTVNGLACRLQNHKWNIGCWHVEILEYSSTKLKRTIHGGTFSLVYLHLYENLSYTLYTLYTFFFLFRYICLVFIYVFLYVYALSCFDLLNGYFTNFNWFWKCCWYFRHTNASWTNSNNNNNNKKPVKSLFGPTMTWHSVYFSEIQRTKLLSSKGKFLSNVLGHKVAFWIHVNENLCS